MRDSTPVRQLVAAMKMMLGKIGETAWSSNDTWSINGQILRVQLLMVKE
jgi:hypothetical protein